MWNVYCISNQSHNMSPNETQSKLNTINHDDKTDSKSEVSNSDQSENSFSPPLSQLPPSPLQLQIPSSTQLPRVRLNGSWFVIRDEVLNFHDRILSHRGPFHDKIKR